MLRRYVLLIIEKCCHKYYYDILLKYIIYHRGDKNINGKGDFYYPED